MPLETASLQNAIPAGTHHIPGIVLKRGNYHLICPNSKSMRSVGIPILLMGKQAQRHYMRILSHTAEKWQSGV